MAAEPLELDTRRRLYQHVLAHPGKYLRELQRDVGMAMGSLEYHLDALAKAGLVTVLHDGNKRFFPNRMDARDKRVLAFLRQELPRRALAIALQEGSCSKTQMLGDLDAAPSTLNHHLRHLVEAGLLVAARDGREAVYEVGDPDAVLRLLVAYRSSLADRMVDKYLDGMDAMRSRPRTSQKV